MSLYPRLLTTGGAYMQDFMVYALFVVFLESWKIQAHSCFLYFLYFLFSLRTPWNMLEKMFWRFDRRARTCWNTLPIILILRSIFSNNFIIISSLIYFIGGLHLCGLIFASFRKSTWNEKKSFFRILAKIYPRGN